MRNHESKKLETSVPENSLGMLLGECGGKGRRILRIITFFRRRTKKITRTVATITMMPAKVPAIIGTEEGMFGSFGSESRVGVDGVDADCDIDIADGIAALFFRENNPVMVGMESAMVCDVELQTDENKISIR